MSTLREEYNLICDRFGKAKQAFGALLRRNYEQCYPYVQQFFHSADPGLVDPLSALDIYTERSKSNMCEHTDAAVDAFLSAPKRVQRLTILGHAKRLLSNCQNSEIDITGYADKIVRTGADKTQQTARNYFNALSRTMKLNTDQFELDMALFVLPTENIFELLQIPSQALQGQLLQGMCDSDSFAGLMKEALPEAEQEMR